jgi:hypothetical protein
VAEDLDLDAVIAARYLREAQQRSSALQVLDDADFEENRDPEAFIDPPTQPLSSTTVNQPSSQPNQSSRQRDSSSDTGPQTSGAPFAGMPQSGPQVPFAQGNQPQTGGGLALANNGQGSAINGNEFAKCLRGDVSGADGFCLTHVADALERAGYTDFRSRLGNYGRTHWAKDAVKALRDDPRFEIVATADRATRSAGPNVPGYVPQLGDIAVWTGGPYGHIEAYGIDRRNPNKGAWQFGYQSSDSNWTGLKNPEARGQFYIFRDKGLKPAPEANVANNANGAQNSEGAGRSMLKNAMGVPGVPPKIPEDQKNSVRVIFSMATKSGYFVCGAEGSETVLAQFKMSSGNGVGYNNPQAQWMPFVGPIPLGDHKIEGEKVFYGTRAWRTSNIGNRYGCLLHTDGIRLRSDQREGASQGCAVVENNRWGEFSAYMDRFQPNLLSVRERWDPPGAGVTATASTRLPSARSAMLTNALANTSNASNTSSGSNASISFSALVEKHQPPL